MKNASRWTKDLEKMPTMYSLKTVMRTPEVATNDLGNACDARFARSFIQAKEGSDLPRVPTATKKA
jgi:NitT/TauT family transport system substrate-binding protein